MHAWEIMSKPVVRVNLSTLVREASALLIRHGVAALPVVNADNQVVGIFTEADALRCGEHLEDVVEAFMTSPVKVVPMDTDVDQIARHMLTDRLRSVPVVKDGVLVGIVSRRDLLRPLVRHDDAIEAQLRSVLADYAGDRDRWHVHVTDGVAVVSGEFDDEAERRVIALLAKCVPGVVCTELRSQAPA
ncbi:CBS domain-containing protein [Amycolatopsis taiwanensis]|uniref:CBS domain-containing protein n=1 Tax=Amycolatopsis taiwanensis TaxID=342230 RepID=UPI000484466C|nr:CBS domain-containing protein [Amycolatopsis taiwanensis]